MCGRGPSSVVRTINADQNTAGRSSGSWRQGLSLEDDIVNVLTCQPGVRIVLEPRIRLSNGKLAGTYALPELVHARRGPLALASCLPIAKALGLELLLFYRTAHGALHLQKRLVQRRIRVPLTIGASMDVLANPSTLDTLTHWAQGFGLALEGIHLELALSSENALDEQLAILHRVHSQGFGLSVAGLDPDSPVLGLIGEMPGARVNLGPQPVDAADERNDAARFDSLIKRAKENRIEVVANSVDSPLQALQLRNRGCDIGQGKLFTRNPLIAHCLQKAVACPAPVEGE